MSKLENLNLSQQIANAIGKSVISGEIAPGNSMPTEAQLSETYGVSRTAIREAVKILTAKGMISSKPRQGIRVEPEMKWNIYDAQVLSWLLASKPSLQVLKEFLQVRIAIEPQAAALAASLANEEAITMIGKAVKDMRAVANNDFEGLHEADLQFHISLLHASGNRFIYQFKEFIETALKVSFQHTTPAKGNNREVCDEHDLIYQAICAGDSELAKKRTIALIEVALGVIEKKIAIENETNRKH